jgi:hypothetical protein
MATPQSASTWLLQCANQFFNCLNYLLISCFFSGVWLKVLWHRSLSRCHLWDIRLAKMYTNKHLFFLQKTESILWHLFWIDTKFYEGGLCFFFYQNVWVSIESLSCVLSKMAVTATTFVLENIIRFLLEMDSRIHTSIHPSQIREIVASLV